MITSSGYPAINNLFVQQGQAAGAGRAPSYLTNFGLYLFSGNLPTNDQLRKFFASGQPANLSAGPISTYISEIQGAVVLRMYSTALQLPVETSGDGIKIKFSLSAAVGTSLLDTPPTHGILIYDCSTLHDTAMVGYRGVEFSVGDENSNADMRIMGGFIPKGAVWKPNDININFSGFAK